MIAGSPRSKLASVFDRSLLPEVPDPNPRFRTTVSKVQLSPRAQTAASTAKLPMDYEGRARIDHNTQRRRLKSIMQTMGTSNGEIPTPDLFLAAKIAKIELPEDFLLKGPYAQKYAAGPWTNESPRAVKWRPFYDAIEHSKVQPDSMDAFTKQHAEREAKKQAKMIAAQEARAAQEAAARAAAIAGAPAPAATAPAVSDEELRKAHTAIKSRLSTQFGELRQSFRALDKDGSGTLSHEECVEAVASLHLGLPKRIVMRIVDIADYDMDGEISFAEFARVLTADDIMALKDTLQSTGWQGGTVDSRKVGRSIKKAPKMVAPGVTEDDLRTSIIAIREKMLNKWTRYDTAFKAIDEDRSGYLTRDEFRFFLKVLNLDLLNEKLIEALVNLMDKDGDGQINHLEFTSLLSAEDPLAAGPLAQKVPVQRVWGH